MRSPIRAYPGTLARLSALDQLAEPLAGAIARLFGGGTVKEVVSGTWLGHPAHPMLTDVTIGSWTSALLLDVLGGRRGRRAADRLIALGVLSAIPTAATGLSDWADTTGTTRRVGMVHGMGNTAALMTFAASWLARKRGARLKGTALGLLGMGIGTATAYLGGHLVYERGVGVNVTAFETPPSEWTAVAEEAQLAEGQPISVTAGPVEVLLVRSDGQIHAIADRCSHLGGPLHQGSFQDATVTCPWHGSVFSLETGELVSGPARTPQPRYETRVNEGRVEIRPVTEA
ncbi:MAG TPA: Rieske 2Fe-2S domain-containing protein [Actinomycetota bacterium]|nr:Rieske 2Fe-2S domain-containing protein [Actinomycetota bacterium]